mgnify:CR=1 FL=1
MGQNPPRKELRIIQLRTMIGRSSSTRPLQRRRESVREKVKQDILKQALNNIQTMHIYTRSKARLEA